MALNPFRHNVAKWPDILEEFGSPMLRLFSHLLLLYMEELKGNLEVVLRPSSGSCSVSGV